MKRLFLTTFAACSVLFAEANANETAPVMVEKPLWELGFGAGAFISQPQYPSSSETQTRGLGLPYIIYRGDVLRIGDGQAARAVTAENEFYEVSLSFDAAFDADSEGNKLRQGMPDLDFIFEVGPQVMFKLQNFTFRDKSRSELQLSLQARAAFSTDFSRIDHRGYVFEPMLRYRHYGLFRPEFEGTLSIRPVWATRDLHAYIYDVAPQFVSNERSVYRSEAGYFGTGINFTGTWHLNEKARIFTGIQTTFHNGAVNRDSPLYEEDFTVGFALGFIWSFLESKQTVMRP
ncbi:MipA/OmpV family protein [Pseudohongiella spirulinae]|uniref:MltA-interacting MipA family protein n=1 Tax=Pseudohongiella spirulinae TaxID=1249552 RepID=A0A0S2KB06_9GAMM|nr:MipA/OmpV family protein [Pseudohongiella spirulinae]ALO45516.1 MltA-interacting MipA family protein [Pseudohongiella spirulinae]